MKNYFKKFSIMFMMALTIIGFGMIQNGTTANAATAGSKLTSAEDGWQRYDATDSRILYNNEGNWAKLISKTNDYLSDTYMGTLSDSVTMGCKITFKFYGSKLRIIGSYSTSEAVSSNGTNISIDGVSDNYNCQGNKMARQIIQYENLKLTKGIHTVTITSANVSMVNVDLDAIDIDDTGYLINPNESITLDKSTMDLKVGDSGQLIATTTPAGAQVTWSSDNTGVATVNPTTGEVTGVSEGTCTITATTADGLTATCIVTVTKKDDPQPTGDANLFIELVDGQIKQYTVSQDEINKFTSWFENRDKDHSLTATYKFTKGTYKDYVVHDQIDWFEVR